METRNSESWRMTSRCRPGPALQTALSKNAPKRSRAGCRVRTRTTIKISIGITKAATSWIVSFQQMKEARGGPAPTLISVAIASTAHSGSMTRNPRTMTSNSPRSHLLSKEIKESHRLALGPRLDLTDIRQGVTRLSQMVRIKFEIPRVKINLTYRTKCNSSSNSRTWPVAPTRKTTTHLTTYRPSNKTNRSTAPKTSSKTFKVPFWATISSSWRIQTLKLRAPAEIWITQLKEIRKIAKWQMTAPIRTRYSRTV